MEVHEVFGQPGKDLATEMGLAEHLIRFACIYPIYLLIFIILTPIALTLIIIVITIIMIPVLVVLNLFLMLPIDFASVMAEILDRLIGLVWNLPETLVNGVPAFYSIYMNWLINLPGYIIGSLHDPHIHLPLFIFLVCVGGALIFITSIAWDTTGLIKYSISGIVINDPKDFLEGLNAYAVEHHLTLKKISDDEYVCSRSEFSRFPRFYFGSILGLFSNLYMFIRMDNGAITITYMGYNKIMSGVLSWIWSYRYISERLDGEVSQRSPPVAGKAQ